MVRMTNTFVLNGPDDPDDIIAATDHGVYVAQLGGGSVNTATGDFVFGMTEAYLIEDGEITEPDPRGQPDRQRPEGAAATSTCSATTSPWAARARAARTARACRSATASPRCG